MSEVKRILFVIEDLKPGGVEVSLVNLLNLLDFETHKFKVTVIMWGNHYERKKIVLRQTFRKNYRYHHAARAGG